MFFLKLSIDLGFFDWHRHALFILKNLPARLMVTVSVNDVNEIKVLLLSNHSPNE